MSGGISMSATPKRGLREAHAHIAMHGRELSQLNLADCTSVRECLEYLREERARLDAVDAQGKQWVLANGVRVEGWSDRRWPTRDEIDAATGGERCVSLMSFDHHALVANARAFAAAGIAEDASDPPGGVIVRDAKGQATGLLLEGACWKIRLAVPELTRQERIDVTRAGLADLARFGFDEVHDLLSPAWLGEALAELERRGELTQRVWLYPAIEELEAVYASRTSWESERVTLAGGKVFIDGTLNSRTAWMLEPYVDGLAALPKGQPMMTYAKIREALALTGRLGVGLATHAIGDAAVRAVLDVGAEAMKASSYQGVKALSASGTSGRAWASAGHGAGGEVPWLRIEHAELIDEKDVPRFAELGVVCSMQPSHLLYDIEALERGLPHRLERVLPIRELMRAGCEPGPDGLLWFGSDVPIVRPDPVDSVVAAVHRRRMAGSPGGKPTERLIAAAQAIDEATAWRAFAARGA